MRYSIVPKRCLDKIVFRLDAEYYHPKYIAIERKVNRYKTLSIRKVNGKLDCSAFYPSITPYYDFDKVGTPFLRVNEIQGGLLDITSNTAFLPKRILDENITTIAKCRPGDLIIAKGGNSLGKVALLTEKYKTYSVCRDLIVLRTEKLKNLDKFYLWIFLHSEVGQKLLLRTASQTGQPHLTIEAIYQLKIPSPSNAFQKKFGALYKQSQALQQLSRRKYQQAESLILSELGLTDWRPKRRLSFVKNFSDTEQAERIDAEYFHPKYEEIIEAIQKYKNGSEPLTRMVSLRKQVSPEDEEIYKYIELSNISTNGSVTGFTEKLGKNLPTRARLQVRPGDVIVSSVEGSLSSIALITEDLSNALCSTGFFVLYSGKVNSETLLVFLKSEIGQLQLKRACSGTILTAINKTNELFRIILPKVSKDCQENIKTKITEMYNQRTLSKALLEIAKRGVEIAIEKNEEDAEEWINSELEKAGIDLD